MANTTPTYYSLPDGPRSGAGFARATERGRLGGAVEAPFESKPRLIDREAQPVPAYELVVGETTLQVLADHVNVLEVPLDPIGLVNRRSPRGVVDRIHDLHREADRVCGGNPQRGAQIERQRVGARRRPDLADRLRQEGPSRSELGLGLSDLGLHHRLLAQQPGRGAR